MPDAKDVLLTKAMLDSSTANFQRSMDAVVGTERARLDGENARRQAEQAARNLEINALARQNDAAQARIDGSKLRQSNARTLDLESYVESLESELEELRETMKEWVASQRGLLALARAQKEEIQSCPNHGHHKLANKDVSNEIGDAAARQAFQSPMPNETPVFSPKNPLVLERAAKRKNN